MCYYLYELKLSSKEAFFLKAKLFAATLSASLLLGHAVPAGAVTINELEQQRNATSASLTKVENEINTLETKKEKILGEIDDLDANLVTTITAIDTLDGQIDQKEKDIAETSKNLDKAIEKENTSYAAMKKRIQYIYETGGNAGWAMLLFSGEDITKLLNKSEFTQNMYKYDRECLEEYASIVEDVKNLKEQELTEKAEFETIKSEQENEKTHLEELLKEAKETSSDYDTKIAKAYETAANYKTVLADQNQAIAVMVEMQRQAEAAAAAAAAEEAARQEAAAAYAAEQQEQQTYDSGSYDSGESAGYDDGGNYSGDSDGSNYSGGSSGSASSGGSSSGSSAGSSSGGSANGQAIVDYAMQYVGNPYVYGGNSLTNGTDCSGFVNQVYGALGYNVARSSSELRSEGKEVSYADAQPGDIVCYSGHVGIYMGDGQIVHASDPTRGIISGTDASYHEILSVRRVVD